DEAALCAATAEPPAQCSAEEGEPLCVDATSTAPAAIPAAPAATEVGPRSLRLAAASRVTREEDASRQSFAPSAEVLAWSAERPRGHFDAAHAWPMAVGLTADALSTYWALQRGAVERNPLLSSSSFDVAMAKIVQFPLLTLAVDSVERHHPKLGRQLRWATLVFHAAL